MTFAEALSGRSLADVPRALTLAIQQHVDALAVHRASLRKAILGRTCYGSFWYEGGLIMTPSGEMFWSVEQAVFHCERVYALLNE
jgi:hypothetical protein